MSQTNRVGKANTKIIKSGNEIAIKYHNTNVIKFNDREVILNSGGYRTNTTKRRINQAANQYGLHIQVYQKDYDWFVCLPSGETLPFSDNMVIGRML